MKSLLVFLSFCVTVSQISGAELNVTIYYHNHGHNCRNFFRNQVHHVLQDLTIRELIYIDLVPFGLCTFTKDPPRVYCYDGYNTCYGNAMNACFMTKYHDDCRQAEFITCCFFEENSSVAGKKCAKKLGLDFSGIEECTTSSEGIDLQIMNGERTTSVTPQLTFIPSVAFDNVFKYEEQSDALYDLKNIIIRKLRAKGIEI